MALQRSYLSKLMLSLLDREGSYDSGPSGWTNTSAVTLTDYADTTAHEEWSDTIQSNIDVISGTEFATKMELIRQGLTINIDQPRVRPTTFTGLLALAMGVPVSATQDGVLAAYRQRIEPAASTSLPSIGAQAVRDQGVGTQYLYAGLHAESFSLRENSAYWHLVSQLIGSGSRTTSATAFPASLVEPWMPLGGAKIYLKDTAGTPISTTLATPSQTAPNLGGGEVNISSRIINFGWNWVNHHVPDFGYRPGTGKVRGDFHPTRRTCEVTFTLETDSATEATELGYYLSQSQLALEWNCKTDTLVAATGAMYFGGILIFPRLQFKMLRRTQTNQLENLQFTGEVLNDGTNPAAVAFGYTAAAAYLA